MKTTHTPGPWNLENSTKGYQFIETGKTEKLTLLIFEKGFNESNAKLIAAAPDLLAVLLEVLADDQVNGILKASVRAHLKSAISKATK